MEREEQRGRNREGETEREAFCRFVGQGVGGLRVAYS